MNNNTHQHSRSLHERPDRFPYNRSGTFLVSALIAATILATGLLAAMQLYSKSGGDNFGDRMFAHYLSSELLEVLRAHDTKTLLEYLAKNPVSGGTADAYPLCTYVNILEPSSGSVANFDELAQLSVDQLARLPAANRFYVVNVIDATSLALVRTPYCQRVASDLLATSPYLQPQERLMVSVGVTWRTHPNKPARSRTIHSTVIPK